MAEYQEREIFAYGRYIHCQILNWQDGPPPKYLICNPLDARYREEFLAHQAMGTWAQCDLRHVLADYAALLDELARLRRLEHAVQFTAKMAWREDPPNANQKLTDEERLSAIKWHPTVKDLGQAFLSEREGQAE